MLPLILNFGTRWMGVIKFTPWPLYLRVETAVPIE